VNEEGEETICRCSICGARIECCEACGDEPCPEAVCFRCLYLGVGQAVPDPHAHGG